MTISKETYVQIKKQKKYFLMKEKKTVMINWDKDNLRKEIIVYLKATNEI
jgi:hypothetical protein